MTIQELKENRNEIITKITEKAGVENLNSIMKAMISVSDFSSTIDECIESAIEVCEFNQYAKKDSKLVALHGAAHIDEKYNAVTKQFERL